MAYYPLSGYELDGLDIYGTYKITIRKITGLFAFLNRKGETMQSWPDTDGDEAFTDSTDIYFEGRDIIMYGVIRADNRNELFQNLDAFKLALQANGERTLEVPYIDIVYNLMYVGGSKLDIKTPWMKTSEWIGEFWVKFREPTPKKTYY